MRSVQSPISGACFFVDTCVIFSEVLKENRARIEKFKKDIANHSVPCYIAASVNRECEEKLETTLDYLGNMVRDSVNGALEESRNNRGISITAPMTTEDMIALDELFRALQDIARTIRPIPLLNPVSVIEEWVVTFLQKKLEEETQLGVPEFILELVKGLLTLTSSIQDPYDELVTFERKFIKKIATAVDNPIINALRRIGIHDPDTTHIASAVNHQIESHEKTVFVTFDYRSIISMREEIERQVRIVCCDPLYAIYYLG